MNAQVTIVDYDCGNLFSVSRALEHCGATFELTADPGKIARAERLLLPGVGAFGRAREALAQNGLVEAIQAFSETQRPFLGICVGMQLMFSASEEFGNHEGFGFIRGVVCAIQNKDRDGGRLKIPHIGWNALYPPKRTNWEGTPLEGCEAGVSAYFVHSFSGHPEDRSHILATTEYGGHEIVAAVHRENMWGFQYHPEKSAEAGLRMIRNFIHGA